ncbi:MAG: leucyl/phenylalanyl-tRNA--protein transferase [Rhodobacteraceae bacterium]|nr:leucyl/phenylalanyl-tRNA--protein transferase [Paracoccaceae bacterium]
MTDKPLTPELLLQAYASGVFPMAESREDQRIFWVDPRKRGILPLNGFHISRSLRRRMLREPYSLSLDRDFAGVIEGCADRSETWINATIKRLYLDLFDMGHGHSIEVWEGAHLVGGVYGVTLGGAFFGESMFSRRVDASKIALAYLVDHLNRAGFRLFDTQFITEHLRSLGGQEISRERYHKRLARAMAVDTEFQAKLPLPPAQDVVQRIGQTS